jgi:hypothetical protein
MGNAEPLGHLFGTGRIPAGEGHDFNAVDLCDRFQMFNAERPLSGDANFHDFEYTFLSADEPNLHGRDLVFEVSQMFLGKNPLVSSPQQLGASHQFMGAARAVRGVRPALVPL